jgi:ArsR family metal-binding transcriptional regulator
MDTGFVEGEPDLLRGFAVVQVMDCIADPAKNRIVAELWDDVSAVFPYLNAAVPNLMYNPGAGTLTAKRGARILTFYPHIAVMAKVDGEEDALAQLRWFQDLCNDVWRRRAEITACYQRRQMLGPLDAYMLLPKLLNCRACGEAGCWAFAFRLLFGEIGPEACPRLRQPEYAEGGRRLAELL